MLARKCSESNDAGRPIGNRPANACPFSRGSELALALTKSSVLVLQWMGKKTKTSRQRVGTSSHLSRTSVEHLVSVMKDFHARRLGALCETTFARLSTNLTRRCDAKHRDICRRGRPRLTEAPTTAQSVAGNTANVKPRRAPGVAVRTLHTIFLGSAPLWHS